MIKGRSSRVHRKEFPHLKEWYGKYFWAPSSYHGSVGAGWDMVEKYISATIHTRIIGDNPEKTLYTGLGHLSEVYRAVTRSRIMNCYMLPLSFGVILLRYASAVTLGCNALRTIWRQLKD